MNKKNSFLFSAGITFMVWAIAWMSNVSIPNPDVVLIIYWYMIWKLFHDKKKDE